MPIYPTHSVPLKVELKQKHVKKWQNESKNLIFRCDKWYTQSSKRVLVDQFNIYLFFDNYQFNRLDNSSLIRDDLVEDGLE